MIKFESEAHLEKFLLENKDEEKVKEALGLDGWDHVKLNNQIRLGKYGVADMIAFCAIDVGGRFDGFEIKIIELKNRPLELKDVAQVGKYRKALIEEGAKAENIQCTLVGTGINDASNDWSFLISQIDWLSVVTFKMDPLDGVTFDYNHSYFFRNAGFTLEDVCKAIFGVEGE